MKYIKLFEEFKAPSRGDKAAITRGDDLTSEDQAAVIYCVAKGWIKDIGLNNVPKETWAELTGLKPVTFNRSVKKMENMIKGIDTSGEVLFPKIINYFEGFGGKLDDKKAEVTALAIECLDKDHEGKGKVKANSTKMDDANIFSEVNSIARGLRKSMSEFIAHDKAVAAVAKKHGISVARIEKLFAK